MITFVSIENLRGIVQGRIDGLTNVSILAGPNNSGKSTVLDAIYLANAPETDNPLNTIGYRRTHRSELAYTFMTPFGAPARGAIECDWEGVRIRYEFQNSPLADGSGAQFAPIAKVANRGNGAEVWKGIPIDLLAPDLGQFDRDRHSFESVFNRVADLGADAVQRLEALMQEAYPPVSRLITRTSRPNQGNNPYLALVVKEGSYPMHVTGDGLQRLFRIACMAATLPNGALLLEEPECYLHPASLRLLAKVILRASADTQIVLTTHSIELIDRLLEFANADSSAPRVSVHRTRLEKGRFSSVALGAQDAERARETVGLELR
jgi:ABC-type histidine transport system ATPase subunit